MPVDLAVTDDGTDVGNFEDCFFDFENCYEAGSEDGNSSESPLHREVDGEERFRNIANGDERCGMLDEFWNIRDFSFGRGNPLYATG
ncbi:hypothetical protein ACP4OV_016659 [Aristida adscensionis]